MKNKRLVIGIWSLGFIWLLGFGIWSLPAGAITDVTPAKSVVNPVSGTLYLPENDASPRIKVYTYASSSWTEAGSSALSLPAGSANYGLAVSADGTKLYASINQGSSSAIKVYSLDSAGLPSDSGTALTGAGWSASSSPAGIALGGGNRLFMADKGVGRFRIFNTSNNTYIRQITEHLAGLTNLYDIAVTSTTDTTYKVYVSHKVEAGKIYVFNYDAASDTATAGSPIPGLSYPTYLKVYNGRLYVAVNGADGIDIRVYNVSDESSVGTVSAGISGSFGWTGFDIANTGWLVYKKATVANESGNRLYAIELSAIGAGSTAQQRETGLASCDAVVIARDKKAIGLTNSRGGSLQQVSNATGSEFPYNNLPVITNLRQYRYDGTTEIPIGGLVPVSSAIPDEEKVIILKFDVADADGDPLRPEGQVRVLPDPSWAGQWLTGEVVAGSGTAQVRRTILNTTANWAWRVRVKDINNNIYSATVYFNGNDNNPDFITDATFPRLTASDPAHDSNNVSTAKEIKLTFSEAVVASTFSYGISPNPGGWAAPQWNADNTEVTLRHDNRFDNNTTYIFTVESAADAAGNNLSYFPLYYFPAGRVFRFTTRATNEPPAAFNLVSPINGAITTVTPALSWDIAVDPESDPVTYNLTINNESGAPVALPPDATGIAGTSYTIPAASALPADRYTWSVAAVDSEEATRVAANAPGLFEVIADNGAAPTVIATDPIDSATDVPTNRNVVITFSERMNSASITSVPEITWPVPTWNADNTVATFPHDALAASTAYELTIAGQDFYGNALNLPGSAAALGANEKLDFISGTGPSTGEVTPVTATLNLTYEATRGNIFWVSLPYINDYHTASGLVAAINTAAGLPADSGSLISIVGRWNSTTQAFEDYNYFDGIGWFGSDFSLITGEAVYLNIVSNVNVTLSGYHDPNFIFNLPYNPDGGNIFFISLPYNGDYSDAASIIADLNTSAGLAPDAGSLANITGRWSPTTQSYEDYNYFDGIGWFGAPYTFTPGEGYYINLANNISTWRPSVR